MSSLGLLDRAMGIIRCCDQEGDANLRCDAMGNAYLDGFDLTDLSDEIMQAVNDFGSFHNDMHAKLRG